MSEIPQGYKDAVLSDFIKFEGGSQPPKSTFIYEKRDGYVRLIQNRDYKTDRYKTYIPIESARKFCTKDDVMIGRYGPPLFQIFRGLEGAYNVALMKAVPKKGIDHEYMYYFLSQVDLANYLSSLSQRSGGQTGVEMDRLLAYSLPLPPLEEQRAIADILGTWDEAITLTESLISALEVRKKGLMQKLLTGEVRFSEFDGDWEEAELSDFFYEFSRKNSENLDLTILSCSKVYGIVPQSEIFDKRIASNDIRRYKIVEKNDLVYDPMLLWDASLNFSERVDIGVISPAYMTLKFIEDNGVREYFKYLLKSHYFREHYKFISQGTNVRRSKAPVKAFLNLSHTMPSNFGEMQKITDILSLCDEQISMQKDLLRVLQQQKKGLMQQLLTGQVRVRV